MNEKRPVYTIRPCVLDDVNRLQPYMRASGWSFDDMKQLLNSDHRFAPVVANADQHAVGYALVQHVFEQQPQHNDMELLELEIIPRYQNTGAATALLTSLCDYAHLHDVGRFLLEVRENNYKARNLYEKLGFRATGRRRNYYWHQETRHDAITYCWRNERILECAL